MRKKKYNEMERKNLEKKIEELSPWYHKIDFGGGIVTPGWDFENVWKPINRLMDKVDYKGKRVLDLASWDGYWAFEAEKRGASLVVSTDAKLKGYRNLLFAREVLESEVIPLCNVPVQELENRLSVIGLPEKYDIIHHFGLFYHLRDPLFSLTQARKLLADDGVLILETAYIDDDSNSYMMFSGLPENHHFYGISDTWAPTKLCLKEILVRSFLRPVREKDWEYMSETKKNVSIMKKKLNATGKATIGRISLLAEVMAEDEGHSVDHWKVFG